MYIHSLTRSNKVVRCIWQGIPQTYIHSLTRSKTNSQMYFTMTSTSVYSPLNKIKKQ